MKKITLVLGGIRSGKSVFAENRALLYHHKPVYIATAIAFDDEMKARIARHRKRRRDRFKLIEEPLDLNRVLAGLSAETVVIDCLTLNLSNRLMEHEKNNSLEGLIQIDDQYLDSLIKLIDQQQLNVILVSNEVGCAPVSTSQIGRYFHDLQGRWNRKIAENADEVFFMQAGIPGQLKKQQVLPFRLGAPSYVLPTGYIENVTHLIGQVNDVELLLFSVQEEDPLFQNEVLNTLAYLQRNADLTYTVHMPLEPTLFENFQGLEQLAIKIIDALSSLKVLAFIFHYDLPDSCHWQDISADAKVEIDELYIGLFRSLLKKFPGLPIALENTSTPVSALDTVVNTNRIAYCIDVGHVLDRQFPLQEIEPRLKQTSVIHIHGVDSSKEKNRDHCAVSFNRDLFNLLEKFTGVLTIEVFHKVLLQKSLALLKDYF